MARPLDRRIRVGRPAPGTAGSAAGPLGPMAEMLFRWLLIVLIGPGISLRALPLSGQTSPDALASGPSTEGALFLLLPVGANAVAMGRAMTALQGAESVWWNPAGLGELTQSRFLLYRGDHPVAGEATAVSFLLSPMALGAFGASYQLMDLGTQDVTDIEGNVTGSLSGRNHLGVFSAAHRIRERVNLGVNVKLVQSRFTCRGQCTNAGVTATTVAFDFGAQFAGVPGVPLRVGAMVAHAGSGFKVEKDGQADPLPTRVRVAAAYEVLGHFLQTDELALHLNVELEDRWRDPGSPATYVGTEFSAGRGDVLYLRAGYVFGAEQQLDGAAVGVGLQYERFDLGLAKSLAASVLPGESEPIHISFGIRF